jgi:hypothetical protein
MNRHAVKQPAAIAGSPPGDPGAPSSRLREVPREGSTGREHRRLPARQLPGPSRNSMWWSGNLIADPSWGACSTR